LSCDLAQARLHAYLDGELDAAGSADFDRHLRNCPVCARAIEEEEALRQGLRQSGLYSRAPAGLKLRIEEGLPGPRVQKSARLGLLSRRWLAVAAALLLATFVGWRQLSIGNQRTYGKAAVVAAVDAHLRSLQPGHLVDVPSSDQHTVKPWFDGKLDFAPPVRDFSSADFPLLGGRLDVIAGRTVAALVYGRRKHFISVFVEKAGSDTSWNGSGEAQGYHWTAWNKDGFAFCAVSDVSATDLDGLKQLFLQE
jgi:anti-sigma factor (TIGR02949 family)